MSSTSSPSSFGKLMGFRSQRILNCFEEMLDGQNLLCPSLPVALEECILQFPDQKSMVRISNSMHKFIDGILPDLYPTFRIFLLQL